MDPVNNNENNFYLLSKFSLEDGSRSPGPRTAFPPSGSGVCFRVGGYAYGPGRGGMQTFGFSYFQVV